MKELLLKAQNGDKEAFTKVILSIKNDLYKIAKMKTNNEDDIQDIIQDTMIDTYKYLKKLKETEKFKQWVIKILINNCNKYYKKRAKYNEIYDSYDIEYYNDNTKYLNNDSMEDTLNFYEMIRPLKYQERIIIFLYYGEKYTTKEISKILNINENTIKTKLTRAKNEIRETYKGGIEIG